MPQVMYIPPYRVEKISPSFIHLTQQEILTNSGDWAYIIIKADDTVIALCPSEQEANSVAVALTSQAVGSEIIGTTDDQPLIAAVVASIEKYLSSFTPVDIEYRIPSSGKLKLEIDLTQRRLDLPKIEGYALKDPQGVVTALIPVIEQYLKSPYMSEFIEKLGGRQTESRGMVTLRIDLNKAFTGEPGAIKGSISEIPS